MVTLERASERWLRALVGDLRSEATVRQYETFQRVFRRWLSERLGRPPTVADLTADNVRAFTGHLMEHGRSRDTVRQYVGVLKLWGAFLAAEYRWDGNPLASLNPGRRQKRPVDVLSEQEVGRMVDAIARTKRSVHLRNRAAVFVLLDTGLRVSELCALELRDVSLPTGRGGDGEVRVRHGKGDKARRVPLKAKAARELELYVEDERPDLEAKAQPTDAVFLSMTGEPWTRQAVLSLIHDLAARAGIEGKRVSPHTFRSTFATETILAGNAVFRVQDAMGHAHADQTAHYVNAAELRKAPFVSPLERWKSIR